MAVSKDEEKFFLFLACSSNNVLGGGAPGGVGGWTMFHSEESLQVLLCFNDLNEIQDFILHKNAKSMGNGY